jgi:hypothetical protein
MQLLMQAYLCLHEFDLLAISFGFERSSKSLRGSFLISNFSCIALRLGLEQLLLLILLFFLLHIEIQ